MIDKIIDSIKKHDNFTILFHKAPDGDALSSALALKKLIEKFGKTASVCSKDKVPSNYKFLPGSKSIIHTTSLQESDAVIFLECSNIERSGYKHNQIKAKVIINIDHHESKGDYGIINWVDSSMSSVAEQIYYLYKKSNTEIDYETALLLYTGILTDTGKFQYTNMKVELYDVIKELVCKGIEVNDVYKEVYGKQKRSYLNVLKYVFNNMEFVENNKVCVSFIKREEFKNSFASINDLDNVTEILRDIEDIEVAIFLKELDSQIVKASFRSSGNIRVDGIAIKHGGGGHKFASGCAIEENLERAKEIILEDINKIINA